MSVRFRQAAGTSWQDPRQPGTWHWRSSSVRYGLGTLVARGIFRWLVAYPVWFYVELYVMLISGTDLLIAWAIEPSARFHMELRRWAWFWYLTTGSR
jgi:hypothetical protein